MRKLGSCLKFRRFNEGSMAGIKHVFFSFIAASLFTSCVIENHQNNDYPTVNSQMSLLEVGCVDSSSSSANESLIYSEIRAEYQALLMEDSLIFSDIISRFYTLEDPLIMSINGFESRYDHLKIRSAQGLLTKKEFVQEIYDLYNEISRFEAQKCSKNVLFLRENKDVRVGIETKKLCQEYLNNDQCSGDESLLGKLINSDRQKFEEAFIDLCLFNKSNLVNCTKKLSLIRKQNALLKHIRAQLSDFEVRKEKDFFTTSGTNKFKCSKNQGVTYLSVNLQSQAYSKNDLELMGKSLSEKWSNDQFKLIVDFNESKNVVTVVAEEGKVSFVRNTQPRTIYLSNSLDLNVRGNVFAHEFGHVLGFPDCYLEFYHKKTKSIVYYELEHENNLMCRVNFDSKIGADYFKQIVERVCTF